MKAPMRSLAVAVAAVALLAWGASSERVELSGPIFPDVLVLYAQEGGNFPATTQGEADLAHRAALTFPYLVSTCAPSYPAITLDAAGGAALSAQVLAGNYEAVARCAYEQHTAKPYWIPKLVNDVDLCGTELGAGWRLPTEADVSTFSEAELQSLAAALSPARGNGSFGAFYFSMHIYVRGADGSLKQADLTPGFSGTRVGPLPGSNGCGAGASAAGCSTTHLESDLSLRCIRRTVEAADAGAP